MELAEVLLALGADELEGVDTIALHVGPIGRDAVVVQQPRQLQARVTHSASAHPHMAPRDGAQHKLNWHHLHLCMLRPQRECSNRQASLWQGWPGQHALGEDGWGASQCGQTQGGGRGSPGCASPPGRWSWGWAAGRAPGPQTGSRPG